MIEVKPRIEKSDFLKLYPHAKRDYTKEIWLFEDRKQFLIAYTGNKLLYLEDKRQMELF
jgi:hypothetical protein